MQSKEPGRTHGIPYDLVLLVITLSKMGDNSHLRRGPPPKEPTSPQSRIVVPDRFEPVDRSGRIIDPDLIEDQRNDKWRLAGCHHSDICAHCGRYDTLHLGTIIIGTDGACRGNGTPRARASIGVVVGTQSRYNLSELIDEGPYTNQRAELYAAFRALDQAATISTSDSLVDDEGEPAPLNAVIIKSDSEYLVKGMTEWVRKWEDNGYLTAKGKPVGNADLFQQLVGMVQFLAAEGVEVLFWHVPRKFNEEADELANRALDDSL